MLDAYIDRQEMLTEAMRGIEPKGGSESNGSPSEKLELLRRLGGRVEVID